MNTLLVTGASGNLGRLTVETLLGANAGKIVAGSRDPGKLADLAAKGAETRAVDFDRPETLRDAFRGVDRLLLVSTDALDRPGHRIAQHRAAIEAAVTAGVRHVVYTSIPNATADSLSLATPDHFLTERTLIASGLGYTILRNTLYMDNLLGALPHLLASGQWYHAAGKGKISLVAREDCARVAAAALAADYEGQRILDVTGGELRDYSETAALLTELSGTRVTAIAVDGATLVGGLTASGLPAGIAELLASFDVAQANGEYAVVSETVPLLTGRPAATLREFFKRNLSAGLTGLPAQMP